MSMTFTESISPKEIKGKSLDIKEAAKTAASPISMNSVMTEYEAIHVGMTRNYTYYTESAIDSCLKSWTFPYQKPIIMHHNDEDGKIIGRVHNAYKESSSTLTGTPALILTGNVAGQDGVDGVKDGRLKTTSIGVTAHEVFCSICGKNLCIEGECEHEPGEYYDGELCYRTITNMEAKELSYVIIPSDAYSQQTSFYDPKEGESKNKNIKESYNGGKIMSTKQEGLDMKEGLAAPEGIPIKEITEENDKKVEDKADSKTIETSEDIKELTSKLVLAEEALAKEQAAKAIIAETLKATELLLKNANASLELAKEEAAASQVELKKEVALRESLESKAIADKIQKKEALIDSVLELRESLNKRTVTRESLSEKTDEFLQEAFLDLKEEASVKTSKTIEVKESFAPVANPGIIDAKNEEKKAIDVKESQHVSNISGEDVIANMMAALMSSNKRSY